MYQITKAKKLADKIYLMDVVAPRVAATLPSGTVHYCKGRRRKVSVFRLQSAIMTEKRELSPSCSRS